MSATDANERNAITHRRVIARPVQRLSVDAGDYKLCPYNFGLKILCGGGGIMWVPVEGHSTIVTDYVDVDKVARVSFIRISGGKVISSATLYALGGNGFVELGTVTDRDSLTKLEQHMGLIRSEAP